MDKDLMENVRKLAKVQAFLREDTNTIATLIQLTEDLAESLTITKAELEQQKEREGKLVETLKYCLKACQCERFPQRKTKRGFDYGEIHPALGKCEAGARWLTPEAKIEATLKELGIL